MRTALADRFDAMVLARALIHEPALVNRFQSGELSRSGCANCNGRIACICHPAGTWRVERPANNLALNQVRAPADKVKPW